MESWVKNNAFNLFDNEVYLTQNDIQALIDLGVTGENIFQILDGFKTYPEWSSGIINGYTDYTKIPGNVLQMSVKVQKIFNTYSQLWEYQTWYKPADMTAINNLIKYTGKINWFYKLEKLFRDGKGLKVEDVNGNIIYVNYEPDLQSVINRVTPVYVQSEPETEELPIIPAEPVTLPNEISPEEIEPAAETPIIINPLESDILPVEPEPVIVNEPVNTSDTQNTPVTEPIIINDFPKDNDVIPAEPVVSEELPIIPAEPETLPNEILPEVIEPAAETPIIINPPESDVLPIEPVTVTVPVEPVIPEPIVNNEIITGPEDTPLFPGGVTTGNDLSRKEIKNKIKNSLLKNRLNKLNKNKPLSRQEKETIYVKDRLIKFEKYKIIEEPELIGA